MTGDRSIPAVDRFIRQNLRLVGVPGLAGIKLHTAHPGSGLLRFALSIEPGGDPPPPYWAYPWAGGIALARYFQDSPDAVAGRAVLDLGTGSGLVGIAAARAGAANVMAIDIDAHALAAARLNAEANDVRLNLSCRDLLSDEPPASDLVVVGDLFYDRETALRVTAFLDRCLEKGIMVLIGDPYRAYLPRERLRLVAEYPVADFGAAPEGPSGSSAVFAFNG